MPSLSDVVHIATTPFGAGRTTGSLEVITMARGARRRFYPTTGGMRYRTSCGPGRRPKTSRTSTAPFLPVDEPRVGGCAGVSAPRYARCRREPRHSPRFIADAYGALLDEPPYRRPSPRQPQRDVSAALTSTRILIKESPKVVRIEASSGVGRDGVHRADRPLSTIAMGVLVRVGRRLRRAQRGDPGLASAAHPMYWRCR